MDGIKVGRILLAVRHDKRIRQQDVGRSAGVGQSVVSRVERGQIDAVTIGTLRKIASALELDLRIELRGRLGDEGEAGSDPSVVGQLARLPGA